MSLCLQVNSRPGPAAGTWPGAMVALWIATGCGADATEKSDPSTGAVDVDGDGYPADTDCNDNDATIYPGAPEDCDGVDNDCDELVDLEDPDILLENVESGWADSDEDGYGDPDRPTDFCSGARPANVSLNTDDCNDRDDKINPEGNEVCDGIDNDCDGLVDADDADAIAIPTWAPDEDGDGYGDAELGFLSCEPMGEGYVEDSSDCDDGAPEVYPEAAETCGDGVDSDCDGADGPARFSGSVDLDCGVVGWRLGAESIDAGDLDGDGHLEVALGSASSGIGVALDAEAADLVTVAGAPADEAFGAALAVGDSGGDGIAELFVGNPSDDGAVYRFTGPITGATAFEDATRLSSPAESMLFGSALAMVPDLGGDGHDDLLIGAPGAAEGIGGVAIVTDASDFDTVEMLQLGRGFPDGAQLGAVITPVGDVDGDGIHDVALGIPGQGAVAVVLGGVTDATVGELVVIQAEAPGSELGRSIAGRQDLDGDGLDDLVIGAPRVPESGGAVFVFVAPSDGQTESDAYSRIDGPEDGASAGASVAAVGHIDDDSSVDITIGAPGFGESTGRLEVVLGPVPTGVPATTNDVAYHLSGRVAGDLAGYATFAPGDINADGYADFIGSAVGDGSTWLFMGAPLF